MPVCNKIIPEKPTEESEYLDLDCNNKKSTQSHHIHHQQQQQQQHYSEGYMNLPQTIEKIENTEKSPLYMNLP